MSADFTPMFKVPPTVLKAAAEGLRRVLADAVLGKSEPFEFTGSTLPGHMDTGRHADAGHADIRP